MPPSVFAHPGLVEHELLDSGAAEKLERFGEVVLRRPDPQALWSRRLDDDAWRAADLTFVRESDRGGRWEARRGAHPSALGRDPAWTIGHGGARFVLRPTPFKHVGIFPEQAANWELVARTAQGFGAERRLLNLFGYTGVASVLAARAGYAVTHVDASRTSISWARENASLSGLTPAALRVLVEDASTFARREVRRGSRYEVVLLDPPHHGRGPKGERWSFEDDIAELVATCRELLAERALVVLSTYAIGTSVLALDNLLRDLGPGDVESGELAIAARNGGQPLPAGFCARWSRGVELA